MVAVSFGNGVAMRNARNVKQFLIFVDRDHVLLLYIIIIYYYIYIYILHLK